MKTAVKVLLVEDMAPDAMLVERTVKKSYPGSQFLCVDDRESYLNALSEYQPEIILSDYSMPHFDGMSALKLALEMVPDTPFIIVTGAINEETAVECIKAGAWDYVLKDHMARLESAIRSAFDQQKIRLERRMAIKALHDSEERYRNLINFAPITIGVIADGRIVYLNPAGLKLIGAESIYEVMGKPIQEIIESEELLSELERIREAQDGEGEMPPREETFRRLDGKMVSVEMTATPLQYNNKKAVQMIVTDITERKRAEREKERLREDLHREKEYLNSLIENANAPIITWEPDLVITECNRAFELLFGANRRDIIGRHIFEAMSGSFDTIAYHYIKETQKGKEWCNLELPIISRQGDKRTVIWSSANIKDSRGKHIATIAQGTDITDRKAAEEKNVYISNHDHLTDLFNRRYFEKMCKKLDDHGSQPLTIMMGDIDGLKLINDSFGHEAGDELLIRASKAIRSGSRAGDIVARIGGDEFGIILQNTEEAEAAEIIRRIKEKAASADPDTELLSISFGYATVKGPGRRIKEALVEAENFMYRRKMYESASIRNKTIDIIMNALYEKSEREMLHSKRVSKICAKIAEELGLASDEVSKIRISGLVHDIGKIGISEKILTKPGPLDEEEWVRMKKHPEAGWRILSSAEEFSDLARHILYHHERWNGSGYPEGLAGEEIPLESRIIAVADAFDAMTSKRVYREPMMLDEVVRELETCAGIQFDRDIVRIFLTNVLHVIDA